VLDVAWAWPSRATVDTFKSIPKRLRETPLRARDGKQLCAALAEELRTTGVVLELGGVSCRPRGGALMSADALDAVPPGKNYRLRLDRQGGRAVGVLTIARFVDPGDDGWRGFGAAMKELAGIELVIVDMQRAEGDDPRAGFAVLAALGLEDYQRAYLQPASFRDNELARTARANVRDLQEPPRERGLWSRFPTGDAVMRIARTIVPGIERPTKPVATRLLAGPACGRACQLVIALAQWQGTEVHGGFENRMSGDEHGAVRLPHSGIVARFPTASYGPYLIGINARPHANADQAKTVLATLHTIARTRSESLAWRTRPLPDCARLPDDPSVLDAKSHGCPATAATLRASIRFSVEASTAKRFLATCMGLAVGSAMDLGVDGASLVTVSGRRSGLAQAARAPFVQSVSWDCEVSPDHRGE
jgi:hypothetical protein